MRHVKDFSEFQERPSVQLVGNIAKSLDSVPMIFDTKCSGFGHPSTAVNVMKNLRTLGFDGTFELFLASQDNVGKLEKLIPGFNGKAKGVQNTPSLGKVIAKPVTQDELNSGSVAKSLKERPLAFGSRCGHQGIDSKGHHLQDVDFFRTNGYNVRAMLNVETPAYRPDTTFEIKAQIKPLGHDKRKRIKVKQGRPGKARPVGGLHMAHKSKKPTPLPANESLAVEPRSFAELAGTLIKLQKAGKITYQPMYGLKNFGSTDDHGDKMLEKLALAWDKMANNKTPPHDYYTAGRPGRNAPEVRGTR